MSETTKILTDRVWLYARGTWAGRLPSLGGDEYGRRTLVLPIPFGPVLVIAYRTCRCAECDEVREQTERWRAEDWLDEETP